MKGKDADVTITKVRGEEEEIHTKLYKVSLLSLKNNSLHHITAIGIPSISDNVASVDVGKVSEKLGLEGRKLVRGNGPIDILIGINHAKMHTGETKEAENLVARRSPLGCVVFGATSGYQRRVNKVLHVQLTNPVDMTDFWTTEAMGVTMKLCKCNPEKLSPILKSLVQSNYAKRRSSKIHVKELEISGWFHIRGKRTKTCYQTTEARRSRN